MSTALYLSIMRAKYASMIDDMEQDYLKPRPLGELKPMASRSALDMPLLKMELEQALQISMEPSEFTIEVYL